MTAVAVARKLRPEDIEQQTGIELLEMLGGKVWRQGVRRRAGDYQGTMQTPGLPDVLAFLPVRGAAGTLALLFWEVKAPGGRLRVEQRAFAGLCFAAQVHHVSGTAADLEAWLAGEGFLRRPARRRV